jgi:hypothetical protein
VFGNLSSALHDMALAAVASQFSGQDGVLTQCENLVVYGVKSDPSDLNNATISAGNASFQFPSNLTAQVRRVAAIASALICVCVDRWQ